MRSASTSQLRCHKFLRLVRCASWETAGSEVSWREERFERRLSAGGVRGGKDEDPFARCVPATRMPQFWQKMTVSGLTMPQ